MTDQTLAEWVEHLEGVLRLRQRAVADALSDLMAAAELDATEVMTSPPEAWTPHYPDALGRVRTARVLLDEAREDLTRVAAARDARFKRRDTESSASRQHYIDTGDYLDLEGATA